MKKKKAGFSNLLIAKASKRVMLILLAGLILAGCQTDNNRVADDMVNFGSSSYDAMFDVNSFRPQVFIPAGDGYNAPASIGNTIQIVFDRLKTDAPEIAETIAKYDMRFTVMKHNSEEEAMSDGTFAFFTPEDPTSFWINSQIVAKQIRSIKRDLAEGIVLSADELRDLAISAIAKTLAHETIHKLQYENGAFDAIKSLKPSDAIIAWNFLEANAFAHETLSFNEAKYSSFDARDAFARDYFFDYSYVDLALHMMILSPYTHFHANRVSADRYLYRISDPGIRKISLEGCMEEIANSGPAGLCGYSPDLIKEIAAAIRVSVKRTRQVIDNAISVLEERNSDIGTLLYKKLALSEKKLAAIDRLFLLNQREKSKTRPEKWASGLADKYRATWFVTSRYETAEGPTR